MIIPGAAMGVTDYVYVAGVPANPDSITAVLYRWVGSTRSASGVTVTCTAVGSGEYRFTWANDAGFARTDELELVALPVVSGVTYPATVWRSHGDVDAVMRGTDSANTTAPDNAGIADIQSRLPAALEGGRMAAELDSATQAQLQAIEDGVDANTGYLVSLVSSLATLAAKFVGITLLADWLRRAFRKDAGTAGMVTAESEINTGGTSTFTGTTDNLEAIKDAGALTVEQASQLNAIQEHTDLITSGTRITVSADGGQDIELKIGDDYYGSNAKRIEVNDSDSAIYDQLTDATNTAVAFGCGITRDTVTGTIDKDTVTHTPASGSVAAYTTVFVECSVDDSLASQETGYDVQITDADGYKKTVFSGDCTLVTDYKS